MKKQEFVIVKGLDIKELRSKVKAIKEEIADLTLDKNMKKLKNLKVISNKRNDIAQILTVMQQKILLAVLELKAAEVQKGEQK